MGCCYNDPAMLNVRSVIIALLVAFVLPSVGFSGISVKPVNLEEMVAKADRVFHGTCERSESRHVESTRIPVIEYTFRVETAIKGVSEGERVVFRQVHWQDAGQTGAPDVPEYKVGQQMLLFLKKDSQGGFTSPVGLRQGAFLVKGKGASAAVMNLDSNRNLTAGMSLARAAENGLTPEEYRTLGRGQEIRLDAFRSMVNRIARARQSRDIQK